MKEQSRKKFQLLTWEISGEEKGINMKLPRYDKMNGIITRHVANCVTSHTKITSAQHYFQKQFCFIVAKPRAVNERDSGFGGLGVACCL